MSVFSLRFYRPSGRGTEHYLTISLVDARILSISHAGGDSDAGPSEQVTFGFSGAVYRDVINSGEYGFTCSATPV
jgi:type VI protein secretion system component Hcp